MNEIEEKIKNKTLILATKKLYLNKIKDPKLK